MEERGEFSKLIGQFFLIKIILQVKNERNYKNTFYFYNQAYKLSS